MFDNLEGDDLVEVLSWYLREHLRDARFEKCLVSIAVICPDITDDVEGRCLFCAPRFPRECGLEQVNWLNVAEAGILEQNHRMDLSCEFFYPAFGNFWNPESLIHLFLQKTN